jgi:uncharacterized protein (UPF0248 family)
MDADIVLKSKFPRDLFNEIKWKGYDINKCRVFYINRGSPGDIDAFEGSRVIEVGPGFLTLKGVPHETYIPYHRIVKIEYEDHEIFIRPGHVLQLCRS